MTDPDSNVRPPPVRPLLRLALFGCAALAAGFFGFICFSVDESRNLVRFGSYYVILGTFALWLRALWRAYRSRSDRTPLPRRELAFAGGTIALLSVVALTQETFRSKILYDEYVLQATAYNLHFFRDNSALVRGYDIGGVFISIDSYVDKRPGFFPFLVSLVHDVAGYRPANAFALNAALFVLTLALLYWVGRRLNGWRGGLLAVALLGSLPLLAQNATGAGMELLNFCMLVLAMILGAAWLRQPDETRLSAFVLGTVLLVQSRYESAIYVLPAAAAIVWGWWRVRRLVLSWAAVIAPFLLVPVALQQKVVANSPVMWELRPNQTTRFSLDYLSGNLRDAWDFFMADGLALANSRAIAVAGALALLIVAGRIVAQRRQLPGLAPLPASLLLFGGGILAITALMMFYYWAAFSDPIASRFALPMYLLLVLAIVVATAWADRKLPASIIGLGAAAVFMLAVSAPKQAYHFYSHMGNDELAWEQRVVASRPPGTKLILSNKSTLPWMITATPAILIERARAVADRLAEHLQLPDFNEILVTQSMRPTSAEGQHQLMPEEALPDWIHLELIAERRFGTKLARISRVVSIDLPADFKPSTPPPAGVDAVQADRPVK
ncbi:MAG: glycosyltransferase family 39 protein [Lacunisphaera sp.]